MRKLVSLLMALMLLLGCAAWAESTAPETFSEMPAANLIELDFGDFTMQVPEEMLGSVAEAIENNVPFFMFYEDYDPAAVFTTNLNGVWSYEELDIDAMEPAAYGQAVLAQVVQGYEASGIGVSNPTLLMADYDEHDGKQAISVIYSTVLDYTGIGMDGQVFLYTLQAAVPIEGVGTYTFTLTTQDLETCDELMAVMDSIKWAA